MLKYKWNLKYLCCNKEFQIQECLSIFVYMVIYGGQQGILQVTLRNTIVHSKVLWIKGNKVMAEFCPRLTLLPFLDQRE